MDGQDWTRPDQIRRAVFAGVSDSVDISSGDVWQYWNDDLAERKRLRAGFRNLLFSGNLVTNPETGDIQRAVLATEVFTLADRAIPRRLQVLSLVIVTLAGTLGVSTGFQPACEGLPVWSRTAIGNRLKIEEAKAKVEAAAAILEALKLNVSALPDTALRSLKDKITIRVRAGSAMADLPDSPTKALAISLMNHLEEDIARENKMIEHLEYYALILRPEETDTDLSTMKGAQQFFLQLCVHRAGILAETWRLTTPDRTVKGSGYLQQLALVLGRLGLIDLTDDRRLKIGAAGTRGAAASEAAAFAERLNDIVRGKARL